MVPKTLWGQFWFYLIPSTLIVAGIFVAGSIGTEPSLVEAVRAHESGGHEWKVGDRELEHKAYTSLQIRQPALDDVNEFYRKEIRKIFGRNKLTIEYLKGNRAALDWVFEKYTNHYATRARLGREPTGEDRARIWNGGPNGWKKKSTRKYWQDVKKVLER